MNINTITFLDFHGPALGGIGKFVSDSRRWISQAKSRQKVYQQTIDELSLCSDRELNDLGIARNDIRRLAHEAVALASSKSN